MEQVVLSREDYDALIDAKEMLEDILAYDKAVVDKDDSLPHEFLVRLIDGESSLAVFREWRGMNQTQLAAASGVNRVQISDIEAERKTGSVATLKKLADALGSTIDDLV